MPGRYLTEATLKEYCHDEKITDMAVYTAAILSAEEHIDDAHGKGRRFEVTSTPVTRLRRPSANSDMLWLPDFKTVTSITENGSLLVNGTDYVLEPFDQVDAHGHTVPYTRAVRYGLTWYYDGPKPTVSVAGIPGWAAIPFLVVEACKVAAKAIIEGRDLRFGLAGLAESGGVSEREAKVVKDSIEAFGRKPGRGRSWGVA